MSSPRTDRRCGGVRQDAGANLVRLECKAFSIGGSHAYHALSGTPKGLAGVVKFELVLRLCKVGTCRTSVRQWGEPKSCTFQAASQLHWLPTSPPFYASAGSQRSNPLGGYVYLCTLPCVLHLALYMRVGD